MNAATEKEVLAVLKDMASLLQKQDSTQEKAKLAKPPKTGEDQKPIKGGVNGPFSPGEGIAQKEFVAIPKAAPIEGSMTPESEDETLLKHEEMEEEGESPEEQVKEEREGEEDEDVDEIKSLLKSMVALLQKSAVTPSISKAEMRAEIRKEADLMLRKMGFHPSKPDVTRFDPTAKSLGVDQTADIKKSEDGVGKLESGISKEQAEALEIVDKMSNKSWREINEMREKLGGFNAFGK